MNIIQALIIDDEMKAQKVLAHILLEEEPDINIIGFAENVVDAVDMINKRKPNLVFLDISLSDGTGFNVLEQIDQIDFEVIFITSHDNYMMRAIQFCAIGYVLKPIDRIELKNAINRAKLEIDKKINHSTILQLIENIKNPGKQNRIGIPSADSIEFIKVENIIRCEGFDGYTKIFIIEHRNIISSYNVGKFRHLLEDYGFLDVHKSHLINPDYIIRYDSEGILTLSDKSSIPVSRRKRTEILDQLKKL